MSTGIKDKKPLETRDHRTYLAILNLWREVVNAGRRTEQPIETRALIGREYRRPLL